MLGNLFYVLHVLGAVLWVGGMAFAIFALRPALAVLEPPQRLALHQGVLSRFFRIVWHAMPAVLLSGWFLLFFWFGGFRNVGWHVHVMHLSAIIMAVIFISIVGGPWKAFRAAMARGDAPAAAKAVVGIRQLVTANLVLGLVTIAIAAWGRFGG